MSHSRWFLCIVILACASPLLAGGDDYLGVGFHLATTLTPGADDSTNLAPGIQVRLRPFRKLGVEASLGVRKEEFANGTLESKGYPIQISALFFLFSGRLDLYLLGGASYMVVNVSDRQDGGTNVEGVPGLHLGGGLQARVYGGWYVHADLRYQSASIDFHDRTLDYDGEILTAGLSYWW